MITTASDGFKEVRPPLSDADVESLKSGDRVRITGIIYTARDAAHGRLLPLMQVVIRNSHAQADTVTVLVRSSMTKVPRVFLRFRDDSTSSSCLPVGGAFISESSTVLLMFTREKSSIRLAA